MFDKAAWSRAYRASHRAEIAAYRESRREKTAAYMRAYYLAHDGANRRRAATLGVGPKLCPKCGKTKLREAYTARNGYCKACRAVDARGRYQMKVAAMERDPTLYRRCEWPSKLKRLYGITADDYHRILAEQGGACALCGSDNPMAGNRTYKRTTRTAFDVDHDHKTGRVRGLLCTRCNRLVGLANDSVTTAQRLVAYLTKEA